MQCLCQWSLSSSSSRVWQRLAVRNCFTVLLGRTMAKGISHEHHHSTCPKAASPISMFPGVAMGLARQVSLIFPTWGPSFASMVISVVVLNEMLGPPLFRYSLVRTGEAKAFEPSDGPELKSVIADK